MPVIRPMTEDDVDAALELTIATFDDLVAPPRTRSPSRRRPTWTRPQLRYSAFVRARPRAARGWRRTSRGWPGCALAVKREGIWGLSLLVVRPGRAVRRRRLGLLRRAHDYAHDAVGPDHPRLARPARDPRLLAPRAATCTRASWPRGRRAACARPRASGRAARTTSRSSRRSTASRAAAARRSSIETLLAMGRRCSSCPSAATPSSATGSLRTLAALGRRERGRGAARRAGAGRGRGHARLHHGGAAVGGRRSAWMPGWTSAAPTAPIFLAATSAASALPAERRLPVSLDTSSA